MLVVSHLFNLAPFDLPVLGEMPEQAPVPEDAFGETVAGKGNDGLRSKLTAERSLLVACLQSV
jgi:hypothetical protein